MSTDLKARIAAAVAHALELDIPERDSDQPMKWELTPPCEYPDLIARSLAPVIREAQAEAYDKGFLDGDLHQYFDGMHPRKPNPYRSNDE